MASQQAQKWMAAAIAAVLMIGSLAWLALRPGDEGEAAPPGAVAAQADSPPGDASPSPEASAALASAPAAPATASPAPAGPPTPSPSSYSPIQQDMLMQPHLADAKGGVRDRGTLEPIAGAIIEGHPARYIRPGLGPGPRLVESAEDGTFALGPLMSKMGTGGTVLHVRAPGHQSLSCWVNDCARPNVPEVEFLLDPGGFVAGLVVDESGNPVASAELGSPLMLDATAGYRAQDCAVSYFDAWHAVSGPDGAFRLEGLPPAGSSVPVSVVAPGFPEQIVTLAVLDQEDARVVLKRGGGARLHGFVRDEAGEPIAGAGVSATVMTPQGPPPSDNASLRAAPRGARSAEDGAYSIGALPPGRLVVKSSNGEQWGTFTEYLDLARGEDRQLDIVLSSRVVLRARAVNIHTGNGVPGLRAAQRLGGAGSLDRPRPAPGEVQSGADGSFTISLLPEGGLSRRELRFETYPPDGYVVVPKPELVCLAFVHPIRVRAEDAANPDHVEIIPLAPAVTRSVEIYEPDGETPARDALANVGLVYRMQVRGTHRADIAGREGTSVSFEATHPSGRAITDITFDRAQQHEPIRLVLGGNAIVSGTIRDPAGNPVGNVSVGIQTDGRRWGVSTRSSSDGRYRIPNAPTGDVRLAVSDRELPPEHRVPPAISLQLEAGKETTGVDFTLLPAVAVEGLVLDDTTAAPIAGAEVTAYIKPGSGMPVRAHTNDVGYFRIEGAPAEGPVSMMMASAPGYLSKRLDQVPLESMPLEILLERGGQLTVRVLDDATGEPVPHFTVGWIPMQGSSLEGRIRREVHDPRGQATLDGLAGPLGILSATGESGALAGAATSEQVDLEALAPGAVVELRLRADGVLRGVVRYSTTGDPVAGATVRVTGYRSPDGSWSAPSHAATPRAVSGADGRFALEGLSPVECHLDAQAPGFRPSGRIDADASSSAEVMIELDPASTLAVVVQDEDGQPVEGARVAASSRDSNAYGESNAAGLALVEGLAPVEHILGVAKDGYVPHQGRVDVARASAEPLVVTLASGVEVRGALRGPAPIRQVYGGLTFTRDGRDYHVRGLPDASSYSTKLAPGAYDITARLGRASLPMTPSPSAVTVPEGPGPVQLDLDFSGFGIATVRITMPPESPVPPVVMGTLSVSSLDGGQQWSAAAMPVPSRQALPPGTYIAAWSINAYPSMEGLRCEGVTEPFTIAPGADIEVPLPLVYTAPEPAAP